MYLWSKMILTKSTLTKAIHLGIEFKIEKYCGYHMQDSIKFANGYFSVDVIFTPIRNADYSVHSFENKNETQKIILIEIWTNQSVTPKEALYEASRNLIDLFIPLQQQGAILQSTYHRKQQRKKFSKTRICEP